MQRLLVLSVCLVLGSFASPVLQQVENVKEKSASELASLAYAVDLSAPVSLSGFQCIRNNLYNVAFIRAYTPVGQGQVDPYACANIQNANAAGMGTEVYMTPQPNSAKTGAQQFDEMYSNLINSNIKVQSVWIQVTSPVNWYVTSSLNINFINSILSRASQYGLTIGIYTNVNEWNQITGSATISNAMLWYWNTYGSGVSNETPANFNDFRPFAGWTYPSVKQFGQVESVCGITVNRDTYSTSSTAAGMSRREKSDHIIVGGLGLGGAAFTEKAEIRQ
nr:Glycoside hydrolase domain containing protein [Haemonchus contortus]